MRKIIAIFVLLLLPVISFADVCNNTYKDIVKIVQEKGFVVTSTIGGRHNKGSRHYQGRAVDISCKMKSEFDILLLKDTMERMGYNFRDERIRPTGQAVWGGPHIHISISPCIMETDEGVEDIS